MLTSHEDKKWAEKIVAKVCDDPSPMVRVHALVGIRKSDPMLSAAGSIRLLSEKDAFIKRLAQKNLMAIYPPLFMEILPGFSDGENKPKDEKPYEEVYFSDEVESHLEKLFSEFIEDSLSSGEKIPDSLLEDLIAFPGMRNRFPALLEKKGGVDAANRFFSLIAEHEKSRFPKEVTVALTYQCNTDCPYCFAVKRRSDKDHLKKCDFVSILDYLEKQGCGIVAFTGGEPTIHPEFGMFLDILRERRFISYFATNNLYSQKTLEKIKPDVVKIIGVHTRAKGELSSKEEAIFLKNLKGLIENGIEIYLRINIYTKHFDNWDHLADLCEKYKIRQVNYAVTFPDPTGSNSYLPKEDLKSLTPALVRFVKDMESRCISAYPSKPIPLCVFNDEDREYMLGQGLLFFGCTVHQRGFTHNLVVNPDLTTMPCVGLPVKGPSLFEFESLEEAGKHFQQILCDLQKKSLFENCDSCQLYHRGVCLGACLAYKTEKADRQWES